MELTQKLVKKNPPYLYVAMTQFHSIKLKFAQRQEKSKSKIINIKNINKLLIL